MDDTIASASRTPHGVSHYISLMSQHMDERCWMVPYSWIHDGGGNSMTYHLLIIGHLFRAHWRTPQLAPLALQRPSSNLGALAYPCPH
eukprot:COSAG01_NODE_3840_length_5646_cov_13.756805_1_plen_87_part_10